LQRHFRSSAENILDGSSFGKLTKEIDSDFVNGEQFPLKSSKEDCDKK